VVEVLQQPHLLQVVMRQVLVLVVAALQVFLEAVQKLVVMALKESLLLLNMCLLNKNTNHIAFIELCK
jgi:hypothetical protein